jgi:uncharacterized GH25 family protein
LRKIILSLCSAILSISLFLPAAGQVMADSGKNNEFTQANKTELTIRMAEKVDVGQPVAITVFTKQNHNTVSQAMVYALKSSQITNTADIANYSTASTDYADMAMKQGLFLGYTGNAGNLEYRFDETGKYIIVAIKDGYIPGVDSLTVNLAAEKGLLVSGPGSVGTGQSAVFKIAERNDGSLVDGAALYASLIGDITAQSVVDSSVEIASELKNVDEIKASGIFMGYSDNDGKLEFQFKEQGNYIVVVVKDGYAPGFTRLTVQSGNADRLFIRAADETTVNEKVLIGVSSDNGQPVYQVEVYILQIWNEINTASLSSNGNKQSKVLSSTGNTGQSYNDEALTAENFIGYTDEDGQISYVFEESGTFAIMAVKDDYLSVRHKIVVTLAGVDSLAIKVPDSAQVNEQVVITALDRSTGATVSGASIYAMKGMNGTGQVNRNTVQSQNQVTVQSNALTDKPLLSTESKKTGMNVTYPSVDEVKESGIFLGDADDNGQVFYSFDNAGQYSIVAIKDDYNPGFGDININNGQTPLYIKVLPTVVVNQETDISVFDRKNSQSVEGAAIYADNMVIAMASSSAVSTNSTDGILLGYTDVNGQLLYKFGETGRYKITAVKDGYVSGSAKLSVYLAEPDELKVESPATAAINEEITIKVLDRNTGNPQEGALIYVLRHGNAINTVSAGAYVNENGKSYKASSYAEIAATEGTYIGDTDENGVLKYAFDSSGWHVIIAMREGFVSGFQHISVAGNVNGALTLKVTDRAAVDIPVTMMSTIDNFSGEALAEVDIYAYKIDGFGSSLSLMFREAFSFGHGARESMAISVSEDGFYIGTTDESGQMEYSFTEVGSYLLIASSDGFTPDFERIEIIDDN